MAGERVLKSQKGNDYTTEVLHEGPRARSKALLVAISHNNQPPGLTLKIVKENRPKTVGSSPASFSETNSISLSEEETAALIDLLQRKAGLVVQGAGTYLKVKSGDVAGLLSEISQRIEQEDPNKVIPLLRTNKFLPRELLDVAALRAKQDALEDFEQLLARNAVEADFQRWFKQNSWVLGSDCVRILDDRRIDVENIADYLTEAYDGHADIIEIKRPGLGFWAAERDHGNLIPHPDLVKAITQAQNYQFELEREMDSIKMQERIQGRPIAKPRSLLIHGRSDKWGDDELRAQRLLNGGFSALQVLSYDQVLARAKRMLGR